MLKSIFEPKDYGNVHRVAGRLAGLLVLGAVVILLPLILTSYQAHIFIMAGINIVLATGFVMVISTGLLNLGAATFWAVGAYASALLVMKLGLSFWASVLLAGIIAGVIALAVGSLLCRFSGILFSILSLIFNAIVVEIFGHFKLFGGWAGIMRIPRPDPIPIPFYNVSIEFISKTAFCYFIILLVFLTAIVFYALYASNIGWALRAIRLKASLALSLGIDIFRYRLLAFVIAAVSSGLVGSFYAHYYQTIDPDTFNPLRSLDIMIYGVVGGIGYQISGPVIGAVVMTVLPEMLRVIEQFEPVVTGLILVIVIIFQPNGITDLLGRGSRVVQTSVAKIGKRMGFMPP
jgi:branched-chain amino acid transport system permease protein